MPEDPPAGYGKGVLSETVRCIPNTTDSPFYEHDLVLKRRFCRGAAFDPGPGQGRRGPLAGRGSRTVGNAPVF